MRSIVKYRSLSIAFVLMCVVLVGAQTPRGLQPEDLYAIKDVADAQISPDGSRVVFTVSETSADRSRMVSQLWMVPTVGGDAKQLTTIEASTPRWSPDGKMIAFYGTRDGQTGLWVISSEGGQPQMLTAVRRTNFFLTHAGESFTWSPDSRRLAFLSSPESPAQTADASKPAPSLGDINERLRRPLTREEIDRLPPAVRDRILQAQGQSTTSPPPPSSTPATGAASTSDDPRVVSRLQYKSRTSFSDGLQSHIFTIDVGTRQTKQLTMGQYYEHSINWSPRGDEIVFVSNHEANPDAVNNTDIFAVNVESLAVRRLTTTKGCEWSPAFSPDGNDIAFLATKREITTIDSVAEDTHLYVMPAKGGEVRDVSAKPDRRVTMFKWVRQDNKVGIIFAVGDYGDTALYCVFDGTTTLYSTHQGQVTSFSFGKENTIVFTASFMSTPSEVYSERPSGFTAGGDTVVLQVLLKKLTSFNDALLANLKLIDYRKSEFRFENEGFAIQGWVVPPLNLDEKKKYPVILTIHGGPHGMHGTGFNPTAQVMAARGYAVLLINPRGSSGYGQKFSDGCINDWGGGDYRDLMKGVDEALTRFPFLDKDRMGVTGGSYGGYMTNWVVTQTDRFKAAVTVASLSNLISFYATSLYQDLVHAEFNGYPWEGNNFEKLWERSPLKHIKQAKTPLLLIHGEQDNDVHITQAEEMFTALRERGIEAVLVRYPREGHGFREPRHRYDQLVRTLDWFGQHLR